MCISGSLDERAVITVSGLFKAYGSRVLFRDASLQVWGRDRIAIVGLNGTGKTTLFEILAGEKDPDRGDVHAAKGAVIGFLRQDTDAMRGRSVLDEVLSVASEVTDTGHRLELLEREIGEVSIEEERRALVEEFGRLHDRFATLGGYSIEHDARRILGGLGFADADVDALTDSFSGGWQMRIALAKLLLAQPDVLMLDEPTNHLDVEAVEWLERFLAGYDGAVLFISHDREFINAIATKVVELSAQTLVSYTGNFESFVAQRRLAIQQAEAKGKQQARERAAMERFINRFRYKKTKARQVQSRIKMLDRMEVVAAPEVRRRAMKLVFPSPPRPGRVPVALEGVSFSYGDRPVYEDIDVVIERGQRIGLVGPNGAGKTTLLKLLAGVLEPSRGDRRLGHNASVGYFAQHQMEALDPSKRVIEEMQAVLSVDGAVRARDVLGRFLFSGDDVDKPVAVLSGGEKTRLALAKMIASPHNVLCLDEPTNHLDIPARDALEDALEDYEGAIVLVTHDRHLIRTVCGTILEVRESGATRFDGDYDYYLSKRDRDAGTEAGLGDRAVSAVSRKDERRSAAEARARLKVLRDRMAAIEDELGELDRAERELSELLGDPDVYASRDDVGDLVRDYEGKRERRAVLEQRWEELATEFEAAEAREAAYIRARSSTR